ncbi:hypothetical protein HOP50_01g08000 [Chloropicon primus]|uniref:Uncharacterized protein n=1 Tax=Chloropicon primus TaxID=1764295 RepID=A0A5B8MF26_9CHLO|nr:hypothetical protein A3770_01p08130 [Chloropicon primus]UPQ97506.1 hypothetical protein HOP50_01g08000 [Chloropicon primus]|mmetsp:Transcript_7476/g.21525  ORF Transcript_7476/g.21525 Transcript_7476/m.21525 type:complete len:245 (+) Transcript_7476:190-924(+)|eukprot:QDZ18295.1 hypothetical protein A3770_01p08130 [Chloropicon primus]
MTKIAFAAAMASCLALAFLSTGANAIGGLVEDPATVLGDLEDLWDDVQSNELVLNIEIPEEVNQTINSVREAIVQADQAAPFLATGIPENLTDTVLALQEELMPVAEDALERVGVPRECVADAYTIATGCAADILQIANQERQALMGRVRANPLMLFQPTSWSILSAGQAQYEQYQESGVGWSVSQTCCSHLASLTAGGCLCDPDTVNFLTSITGQAFLDTVRSSYSSSCPSIGTLALYPSADC